MKYLTVGTSEITRDLFKKVEDTEATNMKPRGGLWFTKYDESYSNYNEWVDYIIENPTVLYYKSKGHSIWQQPCSLVTLKEPAKLFYLNSKDSLNHLRNNYPLEDRKFSYEAISQVYDGLFVDMYGLLSDIEDDETRSRIYKFGVDSLVLFNLDCIDYYQSGVVLIEPYDFEYAKYEGTTYEIKYDNVKKRILEKNKNDLFLK